MAPELSDSATPSTASPATSADRDLTRYAGRRVRHELKFRLIRVLGKQVLARNMLRVTLGGAELEGFASEGYDDHVKLFFPLPGRDAPVMPAAGDTGPRPPARDFTPRRFDRTALTLDIDFALHESGPASDWARRTRQGDALGVGGPRGSLVISEAFDWYLLAGDETALPAIGRRLETAPPNTRMRVVIEAGTRDDWIALPERSDTDVEWVYRDAGNAGGKTLVEAVRQQALPPGTGHAFAAGEFATMTAVRALLAQERGMANFQLRVASYWKRGATAHHENLEAA